MHLRLLPLCNIRGFPQSYQVNSSYTITAVVMVAFSRLLSTWWCEIIPVLFYAAFDSVDHGQQQVKGQDIYLPHKDFNKGIEVRTGHTAIIGTKT